MTLTEARLMGGGPDFEVALAPDLGALAPMRREVAARLAPAALGSATIDNVLLVLSELATNAIQATAGEGTAVHVRVRPRPAAIIAEVENTGRSFVEPSAPPAQLQAASDAEGGRGLVIVRALTDEVTVRFLDGRCVVRAVVPVS
jgi:anti-sigma regulatory factor (Ser/Thr protein kinase)